MKCMYVRASLHSWIKVTDLYQKYMMEMIDERRYVQDDDLRADLFSLLMSALDDGDEQATDRELTGKRLPTVFY